MGDQEAWKRVDQTVEDVLNAKIGPLTKAAVEELRLPIRMGGSGFRSLSWHAAIACVAASSEANMMKAHFIKWMVVLPPDPLFRLAQTSPILALFPSAAALAATVEQDGVELKAKRQKEMGDAVEGERFKTILESATRRTQCRLASSAAPGASAWLIAMPDVSHHLWLGATEFKLLMRLRHGLPLRENQCVCPNCGTAMADEYGDHVTTCMTSGLRSRAHYDLAAELCALMSFGLMLPQREVTPFPGHTGKRLDIAARSGFQGKIGLIDVAVTHALREDVVRPGEAATEYERVKVLEYGELVDPRSQVLVPCVVDSFGAWGTSARHFLRNAARHYATRHGEGKLGEATFYARLNGTLMRALAPALARLVAVDAPEHAPAYDRNVARLTEGANEISEPAYVN